MYLSAFCGLIVFIVKQYIHISCWHIAKIKIKGDTCFWSWCCFTCFRCFSCVWGFCWLFCWGDWYFCWLKCNTYNIKVAYCWILNQRRWIYLVLMLFRLFPVRQLFSGFLLSRSLLLRIGLEPRLGNQVLANNIKWSSIRLKIWSLISSWIS